MECSVVGSLRRLQRLLVPMAFERCAREKISLVRTAVTLAFLSGDSVACRTSVCRCRRRRQQENED
jgi:hypothetical protein